MPEISLPQFKPTMTRRRKIPSWLAVLILASLGISVSPHQVLTRTSEVSRVLSPVLSNYEVIRMEPGEIERQVRTTGELRFRFKEADFYFNLEPHDMRAPNYQAVETGPGGVTRTLPREPVHTFKGVLAGQKDIQGRFNLADGGVEGVVYAPEGWVYVEPLRNYLPSASTGELVVYRQSDLKPGDALKCGVSLSKRLHQGVNGITSRITTFGTPTSYVIDVATEAEYKFVQAMGGSEEANREILGIMNQVEGVYHRELLLQLRISFQHAWDTVNDPYKGKTVLESLDVFRTYWNSSFAASHDYDLAHLWIGRETGFGGRAYQSVVCQRRSHSYSVSRYQKRSLFSNPLVRNYKTTAHEIGHNLGGLHPRFAGVAYTPSLGGCYYTIMWPFANDTLPAAALTFCRSSLEQIEGYVSRYNNCLDTQPVTFKPPTRLAISNSSFSSATFSRIDLTWSDNSTNETGFIVERRRVFWGHWAEIGRTSANTTTFLETGLFPGIDYIYRVRAYNNNELSAYSNQVEVTAASGPQAQKNWRIDTVAGNGEGKPHPVYPANMAGSYSGDGGPAVGASLNYPDGVAVDGAGNLYIADTWNHRIRRVDTTGTITTVAGSGDVEQGRLTSQGWEGGYSGDGGPAVEARLNHPTGVAVDGAGNFYIADTWNNVVRRVGAEGIISTVAGMGDRGFSGDGSPAVEARLNDPRGVAVDSAGNLYIADRANQRIRRVGTQGVITTVAGSGVRGFSGDGGPAVKARFHYPWGLALDGAGNLYIADRENHRIRRVDARGIITTFAGVGSGKSSRLDGPANMAVLDSPRGVAVDRWGNLYIADTQVKHIRRVDTTGTMTTIAGISDSGSHSQFGGDGGMATRARLAFPTGVAVDRSGSVYIADRNNHRIRALARPPQAPTRLTATAVSSSRINLAWQHNSANVEVFRIERRVAGRADWREIGMTAANTRRFTDMGLKPSTSYEYRVRAFNVVLSSDFSNVARATTPDALPLALIRFTPARGPAGTRVTLTGTNLFEATSIEFNGVNAPEFEIVSATTIEVVVPKGAVSGPIKVVAPGGTAVSADPFTVTTGIRSRVFVPIVLRAQGRTPGSFFTSELTLTNRGTTTAAVQYTYTAAFGGGSGTAVDSLQPGRQWVIADAIAYLTSLGVPIGNSSAGGTVAVDFSNLSSPSAAAVTVRVSTPVEEGSGRAGLAFPGLNPDGLLTGPAFVTGLRQNRQDRSNVAVQHAGESSDGNLTLRVTVFSGDPASEVRSVVLPDLLTLKPGGFHQYNRILTEAGFDNGYVKLERVEGEAPYYAYGVINDNFNSDGSFVFPVREASLVGSRGQTLPVIIETKDFSTELTVTNFSPVPKTVDFRFVAEAVETGNDTARFSLRLEAGEQRILPGIVDWLRRQEVEGIGAADEAFVGAVFATVAEGDMSGVLMGARTGSPDTRGGLYSLFYNGVPNGTASTMSAWIYGLQQNEENRSNLALVNTGEVDDSEITLEIDIYDGERKSEPRTRSVRLGPRRWHQLNGILAGTSQGYVEVRKPLGNNPFVAYGVINDGAKRGQRSGDGAFLPSQ